MSQRLGADDIDSNKDLALDQDYADDIDSAISMQRPPFSILQQQQPS